MFQNDFSSGSPRAAQVRTHTISLWQVWLSSVATTLLLSGCEPALEAPPALRPGQPVAEIQFEALNPTGTEVRIRLVLNDPELQKTESRSKDDLAEHPWFQLRRVSAESSGEVPVAGVLGTFRHTNDGLYFHPQFSLLAGETYLAEFVPQIWDPLYTRANVVNETYSVPARPRGMTPKILGFYPSGDEVPANHLKFYIVFSEPMQPGEVWEHFQLIDLTTGEPVPRPFRHTELWTEDGKRLTLWFHPGRQKDGVNLNVEIGAVLEEGRSYRLEIDPTWETLAGTPLGPVPARTFRAGRKDRVQPDLATWKLTVPAAKSHDVFRIDFPEPLDWALLHSQLKVETLDGKPIIGEIQVLASELIWEFRPESRWLPQEYRLVVGSVLEDLAGNSLQRPFEVDLSEGERPPVKEFLSLRFRPK